MILEHGHETVIEHVSASIRFITNRGVTHELVRHRLASYSQESTRYVRYSGELEFIKPVWFDVSDYSETQKQNWLQAMEQAEKFYLEALKAGDKPEQAREILPNAIKTEIVVTANLREWRHIFDMRCSQKAHPQIRVLMLDCLKGFAKEIPVVFDDLVKKYL
jgi:thymidylate synthase (FAD)